MDFEFEIFLEYKDDVIKWGVLVCFVWGVIGFMVGDIFVW